MRVGFSVLALLGVCLSGWPLSAAPAYYWRSLPVGEPPTAQLLTLFCRGCETGDRNSKAGNAGGKEVPLISVLRDTLGEDSNSSKRVTDVWLLTYSRPTLAQKALAAIPFFYWTPSDGSAKVKPRDTEPLLDLSAPQSPAVSNVEGQIVQWTALDTVGMPVRATSRAYRSNQTDNERLHLEEANSYLMRAPVGNGPEELTPGERDFVMARLELRKKLLGGFASGSNAATLGKEEQFENERVRARNWELLRQLAEKSGLVFEPITLAGSGEDYAILWFPTRAVIEPAGSDLNETWNLLAIKNPYADERLRNWTGYTKTDGGQKLIPLAVYGLTYPRQPLLLVDFRSTANMKRRDVMQKSVNEVTAGVLGLSHFTNWYYFVASDFVTFLQERHGKTNNRAERLDSYSQFRVAVALDTSLDPKLREEMQKRSGALSSDPLESSPANEIRAAMNRYDRLTVEAAGDNSRLIKRLDEQRREELASFGITAKRQSMDLLLHAVTFGEYTHQVRRDEDNMALLSVYRRVGYDLDFLDKLVAAGTPPEVTHSDASIRDAVAELGRLMPIVESPQIRQRAKNTLRGLADISSDQKLQADLRQTAQGVEDGRSLWPGGVPGVLAAPSAVEKLQ